MMKRIFVLLFALAPAWGFAAGGGFHLDKANIDPTKLKRSAFIGAAAAWFLADMSADDVPPVLDLLRRNALKRSAEVLEFRRTLKLLDPAAVSDIFFEHERAKIDSIRRFADLPEAHYKVAVGALEHLRPLLLLPVPAIYIPRDDTVYLRNLEVLGPMKPLLGS